MPASDALPVIEAIEDDSVADALDRLWAQGRTTLVTKIEDVKDWIAEGDTRSRRHGLDAPPLEHGFVWVVRVTDHDENWLIAWSKTAPNHAKVHAVAQTFSL